jgi:hypothetical protein
MSVHLNNLSQEAQKIVVTAPESKKPLGKLGESGRIILKWTSNV